MKAILDSAVFDAEAFEAELKNGSPAISVYKSAIQNAQEELTARFKSGRSATELVYARALLIDEILKHAWSMHFDPKDKNILLCAVGGYGRGELHPHSDVDLMILLSKSDKPYRDAIVSFTTFLWDIGLEVGHSVRSIKECHQEAKNDITVATNVQESRLLIGDDRLFQKSRARCAPNKIWASKDFFQAKLEEQQKRHLKFNDTAYNLEPNIKEGPGGLRDIQVIGWVAKRHFDAEELHDLVRHGFLTEQEYTALHEGQSFLWQIRFGLHILTGRREDRFLFDHQRSLAKMFGYIDDHKSRAVEKLMKHYYRTVMELSRLNQMLLQLFQEEILYSKTRAKPVQINNRFRSINGFLEVNDEQTFRRYPFALLEVFLLMAQHPELKDVRANTVRLIRENHDLINDDFREDLRNKSLFMEILRQRHGVTHELRRMNLYGVMAAYLPIFGNIVGQMQHDLFHVYTVDEHTLMVVRNLRRFTVDEFSGEFPLCSDIVKTIPKQELLLLAGLFHDIAKGRGGSHSELGATDAYDFCKSHGLSEYDSKLVSWLVLNHLIMSSTAQKQDINDLDVVHKFAIKVSDLNRLNYLYLLTVADVRATGPSVWNSWKDKLLKDLYRTTRSVIRRGLDNPVLESEIIEDNKTDAIKILTSSSEMDEQSIRQLWTRFTSDYFVRYSADEIARHTELLLREKTNPPPYVKVMHNKKMDGYEIFVYDKVYQNLFTQVTGTLEQQGLSVVDARILTTIDNYSLDTFTALRQADDAVSREIQLDQLESIIINTLKSQESLTTGNSAISRQLKAFNFKTIVDFWIDEKNGRNAMQVTTQDRPGILHQIGCALNDAKMDLQNAKIATYGERAQDIFYFTDMAGNAVESEEQLTKLQQAIIDSLDS